MIPAVLLSLALSWVQVRSDVFVVKSSVGIERAKRVLKELETFRQLIGSTLIFRNVVLPDLPIEVLLVGDEAQYTDLSPEYNGKKIKVAGYYERGQDRDFIVLNGNLRNNSTHVVYHELTHSFVSRSLDVRPEWLSEGLAEYFATAEIQDDAIYLGGLSPERLEFLKYDRLLPLAELLAVDDRSPYYNENRKANIFYSESWAFVHFLMHGPHKEEFTRYLEASIHGNAVFTDHVKTDLKSLEVEFDAYLKARIRMAGREKVKPHPEAWQMTTDQITDADVELTITEIFISTGRFDDARKHLELVAGSDDQFPRASYYRGVFSRITHEGDPREYFIDALMDANFGPRAAVNLVQLREFSIPAARSALEQAAAAGTHMGDVYWALSEIYLDDAHRAWELMKLARTPQPAPRSSGPVVSREEPEVPVRSYARGSGDHFSYELLSPTAEGPRLQKPVAPYFPLELLEQHLSGTVVVDVQVTENGEVGGLWLISATPEIFADLATTAIQEWKFDTTAGKIRVSLQFIP